MAIFCCCLLEISKQFYPVLEYFNLFTEQHQQGQSYNNNNADDDDKSINDDDDENNKRFEVKITNEN